MRGRSETRPGEEFLVHGCEKGPKGLINRYGNYTSYYDRRGNNFKRDQRGKGPLPPFPRDIRLVAVTTALRMHLSVPFEEVWRDFSVLDVGCNLGNTGFELSSLYHCGFVRGVDVDIALIKQANSTMGFLRKCCKESVAKDFSVHYNESDSPEQLTQIDLKQDWPWRVHRLSNLLPSLQSCKALITNSESKYRKFPFNLEFQGECYSRDSNPEKNLSEAISIGVRKIPIMPSSQDDVGHSSECGFRMGQKEVHSQEETTESSAQFPFTDILVPPHASYDVIFMLSVIKWIHVNYGDGSVKRCFQKSWNLLRHGGFLVLEPQPFCSYKNATKRIPFNERPKLGEFRPCHFDDWLVEEGSFERVAVIIPKRDGDSPYHIMMSAETNIEDDVHKDVVEEVLREISQEKKEAKAPSSGYERPIFIYKKVERLRRLGKKRRAPQSAAQEDEPKKRSMIGNISDDG